MRRLVTILVLLSACASTEVGSIGAMLSRNRVNGRVMVRAVPPGTGQRAGLEPGDEIIAIDGHDVHGFVTEEDLRKALRGNVGTKVKLTVLREGARHDLEVERGGSLLEK